LATAAGVGVADALCGIVVGNSVAVVVVMVGRGVVILAVVIDIPGELRVVGEP
jgi:hypothetical protein